MAAVRINMKTLFKMSTILSLVYVVDNRITVFGLRKIGVKSMMVLVYVLQYRIITWLSCILNDVD